MATSLEREAAEQQRWRLRPEWSQLDWHDRLLRREFLAPAEELALQARTLRGILSFAATQTPYYRDLFQRLGFSPERIEGPAGLTALPPLTRADLREHKTDLRAARLPKGEQLGGIARTSGSTGQPVEVLHTKRSRLMFPILKQRHLRWARFDPMGCFALIRSPADLPRHAESKRLSEGDTLRFESWSPQVGSYFETGQLIAFSNRNDLESQLAWLAREQPDYLLCQSAEMEHLALGFRGSSPPTAVKGLFAIGQQMLPEMRATIEHGFSALVHENYGLNEIGIVATRCAEGGRYHVNTEHCLVEVVDEEGQCCAPGKRGRLLVTTLVNAAMPLLRYDSGDLAEAVEGLCPCGRTLPAFGTIHGRYHRLVNLPPGTFTRYSMLRRALGEMPEDLAHTLRQFQIHQYRDNRFELRLVTAGPLSAAFQAYVEAEWQKGDAPVPPLKVLAVEEIPRPRGGKFQDFTSDFEPVPESGTA